MRAVTNRHTNGKSRRCIPTNTTSSRKQRKDMNSTAPSDTARIALGCDPIIPHGTLDPKNTPEAYGWLVFIAVISAITCPITAFMNALIIIAVKTKRRVRTKSNIALACLSTTDLAMGVIGQPLFISGVIAELQGYTSSTYCLRKELGILAIALSGNASLFHIILVNAEKYIAIRHPLQYETVVTEARLIGLSALLWTTVLFIQLIMPAANIDGQTNAQVDGSVAFLSIGLISFCQVMIYVETRRQKKKIAAHQVSLEAKEKFLKQKKAFKVTVIVLCFLILCFLPITFSRILMVNSVVNSVNLLFIFHFTGVLVITLNSLVNPIIYCIRIRQFRVALIQLLLRKDAEKAENIEKRFYGKVNRVAPENLESSGQQNRILDTRSFSSRAEGYFGASVGGPTHVGPQAGSRAKLGSALENALAPKMAE